MQSFIRFWRQKKKMIVAIILAGGRGKRMKSDISKQYMKIEDKPILYYTLKTFIDNKCIDRIILVLPKDEITYCKKDILEKYNLKVDKIVEGGKERQDSVYNALQVIKECELVMIHDGARPFVSNKIIDEGIKNARIYGATAPGVMPKDTIKVIDSNRISKETPNRNALVGVQTPQTFKWDIIRDCHRMVKKEKIVVTDDTMVVERYQNQVYIYEGEYTNIKVTTPEDLVIGEYLIQTIR